MEKSPAKEQLESLACVYGGKICSSAIDAAHGGHLTRKTASEGGFGPAALLCGSLLSVLPPCFRHTAMACVGPTRRVGVR